MLQVAISFETKEEMIWFKSVLDNHPEVFDSRKTTKKNGKHVVTVLIRDEHLGEFLYFVDNDTTAETVSIDNEKFEVSSDVFRNLIKCPTMDNAIISQDINLHMILGKKKNFQL